VAQGIMNPVVVSHTQNTAADTWNVSAAGFIPFQGRIRMVEAVTAEGTITNASNVARYLAPNATPGTGVAFNEAQLRWGEAVRGKAIVTVRMDLAT